MNQECPTCCLLPQNIQMLVGFFFLKSLQCNMLVNMFCSATVLKTATFQINIHLDHRFTLTGCGKQSCVLWESVGNSRAKCPAAADAELRHSADYIRTQYEKMGQQMSGARENHISDGNIIILIFSPCLVPLCKRGKNRTSSCTQKPFGSDSFLQLIMIILCQIRNLN